MIHSFLRRTAAVALLSAVASVSIAADPVLRELQQQDRLLRQPADEPLQSPKPLTRHLSDRPPYQAERQRRRRLEDAAPPMARKARRVETLRRLLEQRPEVLGSQSDDHGPLLVIEGADAAGRDCRRSIAIGAGDSARIALGTTGGSNAQVWLRWQAPAAGNFLLSSRDSSIDSRLAAYAGCGDAHPVAENDDSFGLAAELLLTAEHAGQVWWVEAANLGDAGELVLKATVTRTVSGRVTDESTGLPIPDVRVSIHDQRGYLQSAYTGDDGRYTVSVPSWATGSSFHLRTGTSSGGGEYLYEAWADAPCADPDYYYLSTCATPTPITLGTDGTRSGIDFALGRGAELSGRIVDQTSGVPVAGVEVDLYAADGDRLREVDTDAAGRFRLRGLLPNSSVYAAFYSSGHVGQIYDGISCESFWSCDATEGTPIVLGKTPVSIEVSLRAHSYIDVDLTVGGEPLDYHYYTELALLDADGNGSQIHWQQRPDGRLRIGPVAAGEYRLRAEVPRQSFTELYADVECASDCRAEIARGTPIRVAGNGDSLSLAMDLRPLPDLSGRLTAAAGGAPIPGARVFLYRVGYSSYSYWASAETDALGDYRIEGIEPGSYHVYASATGFVNQLHAGVACESSSPLQTCPVGQVITYNLTSTGQTINFALERSPIVSGRLTSEGGPLPGGIYHSVYSTVQLLRNDLGSAPASFQLDVDAGRYVLSDFNPGSYYLGAAVNGHFRQLHAGVRCTSWSSCNIAAALPVAVGGADVEVDFDLMPSEVRRVSVVDAASGAPLAGVAIDLWDANGRPMGSAMSSASGRALVGVDSWSTLTARLSTDNYGGYVDQVYDRINCAEGSSVYRGGCSLTGASTISLPNADPLAPVIVFALHKSLQVFDDGFE